MPLRPFILTVLGAPWQLLYLVPYWSYVPWLGGGGVLTYSPCGCSASTPFLYVCIGVSSFHLFADAGSQTPARFPAPELAPLCRRISAQTFEPLRYSPCTCPLLGLNFRCVLCFGSLVKSKIFRSLQFLGSGGSIFECTESASLHHPEGDRLGRLASSHASSGYFAMMGKSL